MTGDKLDAVLSNEHFMRLVKIRSRARYLLAFLVLACHAFFVGGITFYQQWFAQPLYQGSSIPKGIFFTALVIVLMLVLEAVYIWLSSNIFDPLQKKIQQEIEG